MFLKRDAKTENLLLADGEEEQGQERNYDLGKI